MAKKKALIGRGQVMQLLFILLLLTLLVGILLTEIGRNVAAVLQQRVQLTSYTEHRTLSGYIFRDEEVLLTTNNGPVEYLAKDGSVLSPSSDVARVYIDERGTDAGDRAAAIYEEIAFLEASLDSPTPSFGGAYLSAYTDTMAALGAGDFRAAALAQDALSLALRAGEVSQADATVRAEIEARIRALYAEIAELIRFVADQPQVVRNGLGGVFYRDIDGYEALFGKHAIDTLTPEGLTERLAANQPAPNAVGKVVDASGFYLAVPMPVAELPGFVTGQSYPVRFLRGGGTVDMTLLRISLSQDASEALLILEGESSPAGLDGSRRQSVEVSLETHEGLSLPSAAILEENGEQFVFVEQDGTAQKRRVEVTYRYQGVVLVLPRDEQGYLAAGEKVLLCARRINEGQAIRA